MFYILLLITAKLGNLMISPTKKTQKGCELNMTVGLCEKNIYSTQLFSFFGVLL